MSPEQALGKRSTRARTSSRWASCSTRWRRGCRRSAATRRPRSSTRSSTASPRPPARLNPERAGRARPHPAQVPREGPGPALPVGARADEPTSSACGATRPRAARPRTCPGLRRGPARAPAARDGRGSRPRSSCWPRPARRWALGRRQAEPGGTDHESPLHHRRGRQGLPAVVPGRREGRLRVERSGLRQLGHLRQGGRTRHEAPAPHGARRRRIRAPSGRPTDGSSRSCGSPRAEPRSTRCPRWEGRSASSSTCADRSGWRTSPSSRPCRGRPTDSPSSTPRRPPPRARARIVRLSLDTPRRRAADFSPGRIARRLQPRGLAGRAPAGVRPLGHAGMGQPGRVGPTPGRWRGPAPDVREVRPVLGPQLDAGRGGDRLLQLLGWWRADGASQRDGRRGAADRGRGPGRRLRLDPGPPDGVRAGQSFVAHALPDSRRGAALRSREPEPLVVSAGANRTPPIRPTGAGSPSSPLAEGPSTSGRATPTGRIRSSSRASSPTRARPAGRPTVGGSSSTLSRRATGTSTSSARTAESPDGSRPSPRRTRRGPGPGTAAPSTSTRIAAVAWRSGRCRPRADAAVQVTRGGGYYARRVGGRPRYVYYSNGAGTPASGGFRRAEAKRRRSSRARSNGELGPRRRGIYYADGQVGAGKSWFAIQYLDLDSRRVSQLFRREGQILLHSLTVLPGREVDPLRGIAPVQLRADARRELPLSRRRGLLADGSARGVLRSTSAISACPRRVAQASGVAHGGSSGRFGSAPRLRSSSTMGLAVLGGPAQRRRADVLVARVRGRRRDRGTARRGPRRPFRANWCSGVTRSQSAGSGSCRARRAARSARASGRRPTSPGTRCASAGPAGSAASGARRARDPRPPR